ncbi:twin-arginine translocation signal domain-containing protein [Rhizobium acaciae]|uniref:twin-arginine translocation signal domain-containing protein n=1 Tax=Rhizobium acaciae TaxID=2989736 RepID=UPI003873074D
MRSCPSAASLAAREITPRDIYLSRRGLLGAAAATAIVIALAFRLPPRHFSGKPSKSSASTRRIPLRILATSNRRPGLSMNLVVGCVRAGNPGSTARQVSHAPHMQQ